MKKNQLQFLLDLVFIIVFNIVFFTVGGTEHSSSVWISYAFIHISYILLLMTPLFVRSSSRSDIFGLTISSVSTTYFVIEFIVGVIFILLRVVPFKFAFIIQIILAGIYVAVLLVNLMTNEHTADNLERHESELVFVKQSSARVKFLMGKLPDKDANKALEKLYDLLHSSPVGSNSGVKNIENSVSANISNLENAVRNADVTKVIDLCTNLMSLAEERNMILKSIQ